MATSCRPSVSVPERVITMEETLELARERHAGHPQLPVALRLMENTGVRTRHMVQPIEETLKHPGFEDRDRLYEREAKARVPAVVRGRGGTGVRLERNGSYLIPETEEWIMYDVKATGFRFLLDKRVPATVEPLAPALMDLAGAHGWDASDLDSVADRPPTSGFPTSCRA